MPSTEKAKNATGDNKKEKKIKKKKDKENGLKRPLSAYMLFNNHVRPEIKQDFPNATICDASKMIGEQWKNLTDVQKSVSTA